MLVTSRDNVLNHVVQMIVGIFDLDEQTKGMMAVRKYSDAPRPTKSISGSCVNYASSTYAEISLDSFSKSRKCVGTYEDPCNEGRYLEYVYKEYDVAITIDVVGCGAFDIAEMLSCNIELINIRNLYFPEYLGYRDQEDIVDVTALEESRHTERVTFGLNLIYCCTAQTGVPCVDFQTDLITVDECGKTNINIITEFQ